MRDYVIITESTTDFSQEMIDELGIHVIPMEFTLKEKNYFNYPDERSISHKEFYEILRSGENSTTSLINSSRFINEFTPFLDQAKDILYIGFSSALSGTYNSSVISSQMLSEKYPDRKIYTVDSLCASMGEGLLVYLAAKKKNEGLSLDELYTWVCDNKQSICQWFTVEDLHHLKRGGRLSATAAVLGTVLSIKPILHVDNEGKLVPIDKVRGRKASVSALLAAMKKRCINPEKQTIFISHADCLEDAQTLSNLVKSELGVKEIIISNIGPVIGSHSGPGTLAAFFVGTQR